MNFFALFRKYPELKTGIINLKSGTVFQGIIYRRRADLLILKNAKILQDRGSKTNHPDIDGEVLLYERDIDFMQVL